ncbi:DUF1566 domain-containing protein [Shewanella waksmanii]|uniref:Lcl domain-containing protein n=1 Tax=Shewanella waksmanii TaxID=213783 RepID=UPI0037366CDC
MIRRLLILLVCFAIGILILKMSDSRTPISATSAEARYIKVSAAGKPLTPWQGPWSCVFDKSQQVLWEVKRDDESIHDGYWSYSWHNGTTGQADMGDCYFESTGCDSQDLIRRTNDEKLCTVTQWRLPSLDELQGLLIAQDRHQQLHIAVDFFPQIRVGDYWSANHNQPLSGVFSDLKEGAIAVDFSQGVSRTLPYRNAAFVLLVTDQLPAQLQSTGTQ